PGKMLAAATRTYAERDLKDGRGLITYVSIRRSMHEGTRLVTYLSPEAYRVTPPRREPAKHDSFPPESRPSNDTNTCKASMGDVVEHIARRESEFTEHPFIGLLNHPDQIENVGTMVRGLTFFVMAFQDVLRLTARLVSDPRLTKIARTHYAEDSGHEQW